MNRVGKKDTKKAKVRQILKKLINDRKKTEIFINKKKLKDGYILKTFRKTCNRKGKKSQKPLIKQQEYGKFCYYKVQ